MPKKTEEQVITTKEKKLSCPHPLKNLPPHLSLQSLQTQTSKRRSPLKIPTGMSCKTPTGPKKSSPAHSAVSKNWRTMEQ